MWDARKEWVCTTMGTRHFFNASATKPFILFSNSHFWRVIGFPLNVQKIIFKVCKNLRFIYDELELTRKWNTFFVVVSSKHKELWFEFKPMWNVALSCICSVFLLMSSTFNVIHFSCPPLWGPFKSVFCIM